MHTPRKIQWCSGLSDGMRTIIRLRGGGRGPASQPPGLRPAVSAAKVSGTMTDAEAVPRWQCRGIGRGSQVGGVSCGGQHALTLRRPVHRAGVVGILGEAVNLLRLQVDDRRWNIQDLGLGLAQHLGVLVPGTAVEEQTVHEYPILQHNKQALVRLHDMPVASAQIVGAACSVDADRVHHPFAMPGTLPQAPPCTRSRRRPSSRNRSQPYRWRASAAWRSSAALQS